MVLASRMHQSTPMRERYDEAYDREAAITYPSIDAFEDERDIRIDRSQLLAAARILACPVKVNPPNWQHGRVLYAELGRYIRDDFDSSDNDGPRVIRVLDVGTAKGFSALCMYWACDDFGDNDTARLDDWEVTSLDVINPFARIRRNTVAELDGFQTLAETLEPWPEARHITFLKASSQEWLQANDKRIHFAFLDGKHNFDTVGRELDMLSRVQKPGDIVVLDDLQVPGVREAAVSAKPYQFSTILSCKSDRTYGIATRMRSYKE